MKYLIVVAHPDDEVLGAGASIKKWTSEGNDNDNDNTISKLYATK